MPHKKKLPAPLQRIFDLIDELPAEEAMLFREILLHGTRNEKTGDMVRPGLIDSAAVQFLIQAERQTKESWARRAERFANHHASYVGRRNRKSSPATIQQDADIARLRDSDRRRWTWKRLGNHYGMTERGARKAYRRYKERQARGE